MKTILALAVCAALAGCIQPCTPGQTRCVGDSAQVCLASGEWREFESCASVGQSSGGTWQCAPSSSVDGGVTCMGSGFCMATEPTPEMVQAFWSYMEGVYNARRIDKASAPEMQLVADILQVLGIEDKQTFLTRFTTTVGTRIYTPFDPGTPTGDYPLWAQITIGTHEFRHVEQFHVEGIDFMARYLASGADRADYEAEAYRTTAELDWWRYRGLDSAGGLANHLKAYNCTAPEIDSAREIIQLSEDTIQNGGLVTDVTRTAVEWLDANAPGLRVRG